MIIYSETIISAKYSRISALSEKADKTGKVNLMKS